LRGDATELIYLRFRSFERLCILNQPKPKSRTASA
jgi:hypothetical protein